MVSKSMLGLLLVFSSIILQVMSFFTQIGTIPRFSVVGQQGVTQIDIGTMSMIWIFMGAIVGVTGIIILFKERKHFKLKL